VKATKESDFRICPACGARNKAKWEYCVSCSESLQGVPLGTPAARGATAATAATSVDDDDEGLPWGKIAGTLLLVGIAFGIYHLARQPNPAPPPELFSIGTLPPSLPPAMAVTEKTPGQEDYDAGLKLLNRNDPAGAAIRFRAATAAASDNHLFRHALAVALWQSGSRADALDSYQQAVRMAPANPTYRLNYAKALTAAGKNEDAVAQYEELIRAHGGQIDALADAARLLAETDPRRAQQLLQRVAAARPGDVVVKQQLASLLDKNGDTEGATAVYAEILAQNPGAHITRGLLAEIELKRGQPQEAVALFRTGLQQYPDVPLLHRGLASALERSGSVAEAIGEYREYARLAPNAPDAQQLRERADRLERQASAAASS
jgi:predicted Zn-dependent protease